MLTGMRLRLPRFRVRTLLAAGAVVAILAGVGLGMVRRTRRFFTRLAQLHYRYEVEHLGTLMGFGAPPPPGSPLLDTGPGRFLHRASVLKDHHGRLRQKYERAARTPWLPVAPDPPPPE